MGVAYSEETDAKLPEIPGGLSVGLARTFKVIEPELKNPQTVYWKRSFQIFQPAAVGIGSETAEAVRRGDKENTEATGRIYGDNKSPCILKPDASVRGRRGCRS
jgi:uncharacterized protein DUF1931